MRRRENGLTRPARIAELVGPPGAGKTSVFCSLVDGDPRVERRPSLPSLGSPAVVAASVLAAIGTVGRRVAFARPFNPEQVRMMAYLDAVPRIFGRREPVEGRVLVFDQGPLYFLSRPSLTHPRLAGWRARTLETWAQLLDLVVVLDAPSALLAERINVRATSHRLKGAADEAAFDGIDTTRERYVEALSELVACADPPTVLRFDTSRRTLPEIVAEILSALTSGGGRPRDASGGVEPRQAVSSS